MSTIHGFLYDSRDEHGPLHGATIGTLVRQPMRGPPWIVVAATLAKVSVPSWPGRLLRVEVVDAARPSEQLPGADYTRAVALRVLDELAPSQLFGPHGDTVVEVIETAQRLSLDSAHALAAALDPLSEHAYMAAWNAWLATEESGISGSPIHDGFWLIHEEVHKRAIVVSGDAALVMEDEGELRLAPPWCDASSSLLNAAMALGAPHLVAPGDREHLLRAWRHARMPGSPI